MTAEDDLDELYGGRPEDFTALRKKLVAAAKKRGDVDGAKQIAAAHRPTTAAWVVNTVVRCDDTARDRLQNLSERLRAAHATMDGMQIRELSAAQRKLVDQLTRAGFAAAGLSTTSAALRDDVAGTLAAAIADPEVAARVGRLAKAERWSGFADFGAVSAVGTRPGKPRARDRTAEAPPMADEIAAVKVRVAAARNDVETAEQQREEAVDVLAKQSAKVATARRRYEKLLETLSAAEHEIAAADAEVDAAQRSADMAAERLDEAKAELAQCERAVGALAKDDAF